MNFPEADSELIYQESKVNVHCIFLYFLYLLLLLPCALSCFIADINLYFSANVTFNGIFSIL